MMAMIDAPPQKMSTRLQATTSARRDVSAISRDRIQPTGVLS